MKKVEKNVIWFGDECQKVEIKNFKLKGEALVELRNICSFFIHDFFIVFNWIHMPFGEVLMKKRTKKIKTSIFAVQSSFYSLKRLNDSHRLTNLFYVCFNGLKLVCKSYVALEFVVKSEFEYWKRMKKPALKLSR